MSVALGEMSVALGRCQLLWGDVSCSGELLWGVALGRCQLLWGVENCSGAAMLLWGVSLLWGVALG